MKTLLFYLTLWVAGMAASAQILPLTTAPDGGNKKAFVSEQIGIVKVSIAYSRPGVKGREGRIWNTPVAHYGFADLGHGTSKAAPWRAGANENTVITFSHPVRVEGRDLPAGAYGLFISLGERSNTVIFSKVSNSWGSFYYDAADDALRVDVEHRELTQPVEWLKYEFTDQTEGGATIALSWEKRMIPFRVEADVHGLQIASFQNEFRTTRPPDDFVQAASYCIANNIALDQALEWMDRAIYFRVMGQKTFRTLSTKAAVLMKLDRMEEAERVMEEALPLGTVQDVHYYGRTLLGIRRYPEAMKVFSSNYRKYPGVFTTNVGMARAWSALGDYRKALVYMKSALPQAPDNYNKASVETMIRKLEANEDVN